MFKKLLSRLSGDEAETKPEEPQEQASETPAEAPQDSPPQGAESDKDQGEHLTYIESAEASATAAQTAPVDKEELKNRVTDMMRTIFDPEIPVNIYDIGLIYKIEPRDDGIVELVMTLTTPNCPAAGILPGEVESKARSVDGVHDVEFELTFDPPWNPDMMSEGAKLELGMM